MRIGDRDRRSARSDGAGDRGVDLAGQQPAADVVARATDAALVPVDDAGHALHVGRDEYLHGQPAVIPPSLLTMVPWMFRASSDARNANSDAMSSGFASPRAPV